MKYDEIRLRLHQYFLELLQQEKAKRSRKAIRFFVFLMIVVAIAVAVNFIFQLQGLPFAAPALIFFVWFFPIRYSGGLDSTSELEWTVKALSGIPKEGAWHLYRIRKVMECDFPFREKCFWLLYDAKLCLRRHPESEVARLYMAKIHKAGLNHGLAVEELDSIVENKGSLLLEAYKLRAEYLKEADKEAAQRDLDTIALMRKDGWIAPKPQIVDATNPMDVSLKLDPLPKTWSSEETDQLISNGRIDEVATAAEELDDEYMAAGLYVKTAKHLFEQKQKKKAQKILSDGIKFVTSLPNGRSWIAYWLTEIGKVQGKYSGKDEAHSTFGLAFEENLKSRYDQDRIFREIFKARLESGLLEDAEKMIPLICSTDESRDSFMLGLADAHFRMGDRSKAEAIRKRVDEANKDNNNPYTGIFMQLGRSYYKTGEHEIARQRLRRAMDLLRENEDFHDTLAEVSEAYYDCNFLQEYLQDIQQYQGEDIEEYIYSAKEFMKEENQS